MDGRITREIEFEFVADGGGGDFVVADQVRSVIMGHLASGEGEA